MMGRFFSLTAAFAGAFCGFLELSSMRAEAGVKFTYVASSASRAGDVYGFIEFNDGVVADIGDTWVLSDIAAYSLNHGSFSFASPTTGFLQDGPGEFGSDDPFANFDVVTNPVQFASDVTQTSFVVIHQTTSAIFDNSPLTAGQFQDLVSITWTREVPQPNDSVPEPGLLLLLGLGLAGMGVANGYRRRVH